VESRRGYFRRMREASRRREVAAGLQSRLIIRRAAARPDGEVRVRSLPDQDAFRHRPWRHASRRRHRARERHVVMHVSRHAGTQLAPPVTRDSNHLAARRRRVHRRCERPIDADALADGIRVMPDRARHRLADDHHRRAAVVFFGETAPFNDLDAQDVEQRWCCLDQRRQPAVETRVIDTGHGDRCPVDAGAKRQDGEDCCRIDACHRSQSIERGGEELILIAHRRRPVFERDDEHVVQLRFVPLAMRM